MLILDRKPGQSITINENIIITILKFQNNFSQVSVGISAPKTIQVDRTEVYIAKLNASLARSKVSGSK